MASCRFFLLMSGLAVVVFPESPDHVLYNSGYITSPNYPRPYEDAPYNNYTYRLLSNNTDDAMVLTFSSFQLLPTDYVKIKDNSSRLLAEFRGAKEDKFGVTTIKTTNSKQLSLTVQFVFQNTSHGQATGFNASFNTETWSGLIGQTKFNKEKGHVTSPGWPANFPPVVRTVDYKISAPHTQGKINLTITHYDFKNTKENKLFMSKGKSYSTSKDNKELKESDKGTFIYTDSRDVVLRFVISDETPSAQGFRIEFQQYCVDKSLKMSCEQADHYGVRRTLIIVFGSIALALAIIALGFFLRWYIKKGSPTDSERAYLIQ